MTLELLQRIQHLCDLELGKGVVKFLTNKILRKLDTSPMSNPRLKKLDAGGQEGN